MVSGMDVCSLVVGVDNDHNLRHMNGWSGHTYRLGKVPCDELWLISDTLHH